MSYQGIVHPSLDKPARAICVVGVDLCMEISGSSPRILVNIPNMVLVTTDKEGANTQLLLCESMDVLVTMAAPSPDIGEDKVSVAYYLPDGEVPVATAEFFLTGLKVSLDVDINRSGQVEVTVTNGLRKTGSGAPVVGEPSCS